MFPLKQIPKPTLHSCRLILGQLELLEHMQQNMWRRGEIRMCLFVSKRRNLSSEKIVPTFLFIRHRVDREIATWLRMGEVRQSAQVRRQQLDLVVQTHVVSFSFVYIVFFHIWLAPGNSGARCLHPTYAICYFF